MTKSDDCPSWQLVLTAAGSGTRLGAGIPKALVEIAGKPLLTWAFERVAGAPGLEKIVVTAPETDLPAFQACLPDNYPHPCTFVAGGDTRAASVQAGLKALKAQLAADHAATSNDHANFDSRVLVHDAARTWCPPEVFATVASSLTDQVRAVIPALPVVDTIKTIRIAEDGEWVETTPARDLLRAVQTPQGFWLNQVLALGQSPEATSASVTDEASLYEAHGIGVKLVAGSPSALKITNPEDLEWLSREIAGNPNK
ncbi:2-C-methyl-D-erythritol 4-phosphate cytidylyltransferase [Boudabousia tangfeifanii]|uniref:2-C-methyl-D-erythritol 4-phosphate cytidylyltransferase n=1 Tax=Boudabousia tangfeifanii TaxID=1912795 RepID=A0A1D9MLV4_9ACTO|nr:2-C-methyl-D-erythritol 4-phosphate cytidylyltransferase [Boudabousia tangfeifanii]AOZ73287.1 2-C-methyl-D-erythritol 4-phosphate cytidylyltransferase [Boudabousia tangfeifanii]